MYVYLITIFVVLLIYSAVLDYRTSQVPRVAGYGLLLTALASLVIAGLWWEAALLVLVVFGTGSGFVQMLASVVAVLLFTQTGVEASLPLVFGLFVFSLLFAVRAIGGGDAQLAFALIALFRDWEILGMLVVFSMVVWAVVSLRKYGLSDWWKRSVDVSKKMFRGETEDEQAMRIAWAPIAAAAGVVHLVIDLVEF